MQLCSRILNAKGKVHSKPVGLHVQCGPSFCSSHLEYLVTLMSKILLSTSKSTGCISLETSLIGTAQNIQADVSMLGDSLLCKDT